MLAQSAIAAAAQTTSGPYSSQMTCYHAVQWLMAAESRLSSPL